ncbi:MAG: hypothetical protein B7Z44_10600 [Caulobacter sp. 12-67-6]|nr:MAG: hypothetical protein B7Z44_10600 [Caulobacter sp. 12-67-6]OYX72804.1 MAG: hypothetical protein B7Y81_05270 [Caulobacter sp. 32-67-35]OYX95718.1 MAG: hypothetical protein B7Y78_04670 [Caulobacter sp. 35-67-4]OZA72908.1 MAG: hypothetical protein B7X77_10900 [Caulobacter sp. 39-67-4]HQR89159.1 DUF885 domain-containing protein [Caulobacter sp.]
MINRRDMMGGAVVGAALLTAGGAQARISGDGPLRTLLDKIAKGGPAVERLAVLKDFRPANLSPVAQLDFDAVLQSLETEAEIVRRFPFGTGASSPYVVTTRSGVWLKAVDAAKSADAAADAVKRLDTETARIAEDAAKGVILPAFVIDKVVAGLAQIAKAVEAAPDLAAALGRQHDALIALRSQAGKGIGVHRFKDGEAYYALLLKAAMGADITPAQAWDRADAAAKALTARAETLLTAQGLREGTVGARLAALSLDERWLYTDDDAGRDRLTADMNAWLARAVARLPMSFATVAPGSRAVSMRRMSPADEAARRQGYREAPSFDGSRPGVYYADLNTIRTRPSWTLPSVVHHESVAGHMVQMPLEEGSGAHPLRSRIAFPGFSEGWAIYAEQLADEEGAFAGDPLAQLGYIQWMLFRVGRLLADLGIHLKGWSVEKTTAFLNDLQGPPPVFSPVSQGIERIAIGPAASAGQGLAWLELVRLREAARKLSGSGFDIRAFHDAVLAQGTLPLSMLRARVLGASAA